MSTDHRRPLLSVESISKSFAGIPALADVNLQIGRGELFALLGASGSGKTTLLRIIAGLERPDSGRIRIEGRDVTGLPAYERPVNTVFQSYALFPHMTVRGNIAFGLKQDRLPRETIEARVREMLELVQMSEYAARRPHQLSGGQRQRVALARSLAKLPKLLLLDEPMAALDRKLREQMRVELVTIQKRVGITFILVTHDQEEALSLASRLAVMERGRIVQVGTPREIYDRPASRFVASFIGQINLFEGRVIERAGGMLTIRPDDGGPDIRATDGAAADVGDAVAVAVRPEKMRVGRAGPGANVRRGLVRHVEFLGESSAVHVEIGAGPRVRVSVPHGNGAAMPSTGDIVEVSWPAEAGVILRN